MDFILTVLKYGFGFITGLIIFAILTKIAIEIIIAALLEKRGE